MPVALADVPQVVVDAVIATDDDAIYEHDGVSLRGVVTDGTGRRAQIGRPRWHDRHDAVVARRVVRWLHAAARGRRVDSSPKGMESMQGVAGVNVTGGSFPAPIWGAFMATAMAPAPIVEFSAPDGTRWPAPTTIGTLSPGVLIPGAPVVTDTTTTTTIRGRRQPSTTTTTEQPRRRRDRDG